MIDYSQLLVVDAKTTLWAKSSDRGANEKEELISLGIALIDTIKQEIIEREDILVIPTKSKVSDYCHQLYGISQEQIDKNGVPFESAYRRMRVHFMSRDRVWCSWGGNTQFILNSATRQRSLESLFNYPALDISHIFSLFSGKIVEDDTPSIAEAYEHCGQKLNELNDAVAIAKLILKMGYGIRSPKLNQAHKGNFFTRVSN